jgi:hypothetical protein
MRLRGLCGVHNEFLCSINIRNLIRNFSKASCMIEPEHVSTSGSIIWTIDLQYPSESNGYNVHGTGAPVHTQIEYGVPQTH